MDERDIVERAEAWVAAGYGGEVQGGIIRDLLSALSTTQAELAALRADHAEMVDGKVILSEAALGELQAQAAALVALRARVVEVGRPILNMHFTDAQLRALSNLVKEVESGT